MSIIRAPAEYPADEAVDGLFRALDLDPLNPFADMVNRTGTVTIKPNWVLHANGLGHDLSSLVTHPTIVLAVAERAARALRGRGTIIIGDAPVQGCDFEALLRGMRFRQSLATLQATYPDVAFLVEDWRLTVMHGARGSDIQQVSRGYAPETHRLVDLGERSFLEDIVNKSSRFRVTCYAPSQMHPHHKPGTHEYLVTRRVLESDLVINVAKFKTHKKAGLTGAMKNLVGINGHKEYLPHHVQGPAAKGGDCYRDPGLLRKSMNASTTIRGTTSPSSALPVGRPPCGYLA